MKRSSIIRRIQNRASALDYFYRLKLYGKNKHLFVLRIGKERKVLRTLRETKLRNLELPF